MARYLITYSGMEHPTPGMMEAGRAAFGAWMESFIARGGTLQINARL